MTYPQQNVIDEITANFVPVKLTSADHRELARGFDVRWLPALLVTDETKRPHSKSIGFLPADDLLAELSFGRGMAAMANKDYDTAMRVLTESADRWPDNPRAPEALYWVTVVGIRRTKSYDQNVIRRIVEDWPRSQWRRKVEYLLE